ncbi:helix-turn-helix domain-containing protein [Micromonospora sp. NPDC005171]|uniref:helix-turn-helix transcriptional regulator n=1 Tax=Micromonospora sp. NPDC005171 TaxID=3156866 RepID=UPI0033B6DF1D
MNSTPLDAAMVSAVELRLVLAARQRELVRAQHRLIDQYAQLERLEEHRSASGHGPDDVVRDWTEFTRLADRLSAEAPDDCRVLLGMPPDPTTAEPGLPVDGRHRTILDRRLLELPGGLDRATGATHPGGETRIFAAIPTTMVISAKMAVVAPTDTHRSAGWVLRAPALVDLAGHYFDSLWRQAQPLATETTAGRDAPSEVQLQILRLAAHGAKDEAIARSLGRSPRWVRRHFELLSERLGASNRLTLGIAAAQRGWV